MSGLRIVSSDGSVPSVVIHDPPSGIYRQLRYVPAPPQDAEAIDVTETAEIAFHGTEAQVLTLKADLERLCQQARTYATRQVGPRIYVEFRSRDSDPWYRSELFAGRVSPHERALDSHMLPAGELHLALHLTRDVSWEGPSTPLTLSNGHGTGTEVAVYSTNDATYDHWATITTPIAGELPAPLRLEYENRTSGPRRTAVVLVGHSAFTSGITTSQLTLENSAMTFFGGSLINGAYSGGNARSWTVSGETFLGYWTLPSALLQAALGQPFQFVLRTYLPTDIEVRYSLRIANLTPLFISPWQRVTNGHTHHMGPQQRLPPYAYGLTVAMAPITLSIEARPVPGVSSGTLQLDALHLIPAESLRILRPIGYNLAQNVTLVDDPSTAQIYTAGWAGGALGNYVADGLPIMLQPGRTNRLFVLANDDSGGADVSRYGVLRCSYRPRRVTL
jgi:hypothetical protein